MSKNLERAGSSLLEIIKLSPVYLIGIIIFSGSILFIGTNDAIMTFFGIKTSLFEKLKIYVSIIFILAMSLLLAHAIFSTLTKLRKTVNDYSARKFRQKRLRELTEEEKKILSPYIFKGTRTQTLDYTNGTVNELERYLIIYRTSILSQGGVYFSYNIQPWAWEYLNKHSKLLESADINKVIL